MWWEPNKRVYPAYSEVLLNLLIHWYEISTSFLGYLSKSCGESRLKKIVKLLRVLVILGIRSKISRASTNKLEETICVFFVTIILKTWNNIPSIVFYCFSTGLMYDNFFRKGFKSIMILVVMEGVVGKKITWAS